VQFKEKNGIDVNNISKFGDTIKKDEIKDELIKINKLMR
jgi:hypothetical protein